MAVKLAHLTAGYLESQMVAPRVLLMVAHSVALSAAPLAARTVDMSEENSADWLDARWVVPLVECLEKSKAVQSADRLAPKMVV